MVTLKELISNVETLNEFWNILLGQQLKLYNVHKSHTYIFLNSDRLLIWRLIIEEYVPGIENKPQ